MILVDANVLLYAHHSAAPQHERCRRWLAKAILGPAPLLLPWSVLLAFLRIGTNPRAFASPLSMAEACRSIDALLAQPAASVIGPGDRHWEILQGLLSEAQIRGALVTDAHLAALAIENGAAVSTTDRDFRRFSGLKLINPLED